MCFIDGGLDDFVEFCKKNKFFVPLTDAEEAGIKLLDVLHKKRKSPLNAYAMLMDWHLCDKGVRQEQQTLKDAGTAIFIGRAIC
jgi:hypothetical protein